MEFDSSRAWGDATETVSANREVLLPLAGVFLVLPSFAMAVMRPQPQVIAGASPRAVFAQLSEYFSQILPFYVMLALASLIGTLAILALFTDATRPTVGEAIRQGARALLVVFGAQLLVGLTIGAIGVALVGLAVALQLRALIVLIALPLMVGLIYISVHPPGVSIPPVSENLPPG